MKNGKEMKIASGEVFVSESVYIQAGDSRPIYPK